MTKKKGKKLTGGERKLASRFIREEIETGAYPRKQAIAIGISRARSGMKKARRKRAIESIMARHT